MEISNYLNNFFLKGNICKGDRVLLHSDISILYKNLKKEKFKFTIDDIADFLINYIGDKGTLIIPTFNFNFCKGETFLINNTVSQMGVLSEKLRIKANKNRSWHPVYSFVIFGSTPKEYLKKKNYSAYSKDSLFHWITESDGKIGIIDLPDQKSMTYYHYVEECMNVNWRYMKSFWGDYIDFNNKTQKIEAKIFVRKINKGIKTKVEEMEKILWSKDLYQGHKKYSYAGCRSIRAKNLKFEVEKIIKDNKALGVLYENEKIY